MSFSLVAPGSVLAFLPASFEAISLPAHNLFKTIVSSCANRRR
jgi:hypothetical protein